MRVTYLRTQVPIYSPEISIAEQRNYGGPFELVGDFATDDRGVHIPFPNGEVQLVPWTNVAHVRYRAEAPVVQAAAPRKGGR